VTIIALLVALMLATWGIVGTIIDNINDREDRP